MTEKKRLRCAFVLNRFYPEVGGAEINLYHQVEKLSESYDVTVLSPRRMDVVRNETIGKFKVKRFFDILNPFSKFPKLGPKTVSPGMFFDVLCGKYDIIISFPAVNYNNMLVFFAAWMRGIPKVLCSFDLLDYAEIINKTGNINPNILDDYVLDSKRKFFIERYDHIFAISNREIDFYKKFNKSVSYSPVPVLKDKFVGQAENPKANYGIPDDEFVYLSLGRVSKIKGQDIALEAFEKIASKVPNSKLVFVGRSDYEPHFLEKMKQFIKEKNLEDRVIFTGMVEESEVLGWLRYCDIHVIPVRFMNSGAVVVETWISDRPVIQSDSVDPNLVIENQNGYNFDSENSDMLSEKMVKAYEDRDSLASFGLNGKKLVLEKYTYDHLIELYKDVFEKLVK